MTNDKGSWMDNNYFKGCTYALVFGGFVLLCISLIFYFIADNADMDVDDRQKNLSVGRILLIIGIVLLVIGLVLAFVKWKTTRGSTSLAQA